MEDNDFGGLGRDLERARQRGMYVSGEPIPHERRYLVDPPGGTGFQRRHFDLYEHAEEYADRCPARTRIIDRIAEAEAPAVEPANPPNPKQRYGDTKVPLGLVPPAAKVYAALAHQEGAEKYGPFNWRETGVEAMTYVHAVQRHLDAWVDGEELAPDSGAPHLGHILASINILIDAYECGKLIDNRPPPAPTGELHASWQKPLPCCPLDGRNCTPDHGHPSILATENVTARQVYERFGHPALGEGDEPTAYNPVEQFDVYTAAKENYPAAKEKSPEPCDHLWTTLGCPINIKRCIGCSEQRPITTWRADFNRKHACSCSVPGLCAVDHGVPVGNNVYCTKAELGL